jgi:hypothetical protein
MGSFALPPWGCPASWEAGDDPERAWHRQLILVLRRLDEQQRRRVATMDADRVGRGGETLVARVTGLDEKTIRRGHEDLVASLADRPPDPVRRPGGGRLPSEKRTPPSSSR